MQKYRVELLSVAYDDLDEVCDYIALDNPRAAERMLDTIMDALHRLEDFPLSGTPLLDNTLNGYGFRMVVVHPYIAFYRVTGDNVIVYRVLHGARNYPHLLKNSME